VSSSSQRKPKPTFWWTMMTFVEGADRVHFVTGSYKGRKGTYLRPAGVVGLSARVKVDADTTSRISPLVGPVFRKLIGFKNHLFKPSPTSQMPILFWKIARQSYSRARILRAPYVPAENSLREPLGFHDLYNQ
jgi:hypothetical protein